MELSDFEENMQREINAFLNAGKGEERKAKVPPARRAEKARPSKHRPTSQRTGHIIKLAVRSKPLELDTVFEHRSTSISKLEAQLDAEQAARKAGFPVIGHVIEIQRL